MSDVIKMTGRLLVFDKPDINRNIFPKGCEITFPEKVPVIRNFQFDRPDAVLGSATVTKDEKGLVCDVELTNFDRNVLHEYFGDELYIGGYYDQAKMGYKNGVKIINKARLVCIGTVFDPADVELKIVLKED